MSPFQGFSNRRQLFGMPVFAKNTSSSGVQTSRAASPRRTRDNQHHKNHTIHKTSVADNGDDKSPKGLIFITEVIDLRNTTTNKHCLKRKFDVVKGRTCDVKNPAFQAAVECVTLSASCASLACGYENQALRATGENVIAAIFAKNTSRVRRGDAARDVCTPDDNVFFANTDIPNNCRRFEKGMSKKRKTPRLSERRRRLL
jgi:hypothetical protein